MPKARHLSNAVSKSVFIKTAYKTNAKNVMPSVMQAGYRM